MKRILLIATGLLLAGNALAAHSVYPTGVTRYDPAKAWNHYTVFSGADEKSYLIDMNGNVVQHWPYKGFPAEVINPAVNGGRKGHVFVQLEERKDKNERSFGNGVNNHAVGELDWNGKVVWRWAGEKAVGNAHQHHEITRLANGNTLVLANLLHKVPGFKLDQLIDDALYEVDPEGKVVWRWLASEHLEEFGFTPEQLELVRNTHIADYLHFNNAVPLGENKWHEAGDARFHPDNIIVDSRQANFIAIIDRQTGKVVWNLGPNYASAEVANPFAGKPTFPRPVDQLSGQHDAKIIAKGPKGELSFAGSEDVEVKIEGNVISFAPRNETKRARAMWGTTRAQVQNIVTGSTQGFEKKLEINGVGYRAAVAGKVLQLSLGYSHDVNYPIPEGITITTPKPTEITISGSDRQRVGPVFARPSQPRRCCRTDGR